MAACQHDALVEINAQLQEGELLFAFLDDVYVLCQPERVKVVYQLVEKTLEKRTGIHCNKGKTGVWNKCGKNHQR